MDTLLGGSEWCCPSGSESCDSRLLSLLPSRSFFSSILSEIDFRVLVAVLIIWSDEVLNFWEAASSAFAFSSISVSWLSADTYASVAVASRSARSSIVARFVARTSLLCAVTNSLALACLVDTCL